MKKIIIGCVSLAFLAGLAFAVGNHNGELKDLDIKVVYKNPYFTTSDGYPGYYIGLPMNFELQIKNNSPRSYNHIDINTRQEYHENKTCDRWWYPYPQSVKVTIGQPMPGESTQNWNDITIRGGATLILNGNYTAPIETCDGLDQTRIKIKHSNNGQEESAEFINDVIGVYCPPPPPK